MRESKRRLIEALQRGETTLAELKGLGEAELGAGVRAARRLIERGELEAAAEVLAGLALYDPYRPDVWRALEDLSRRQLRPEAAALFAGLARAMAA